MEKKTLGVKFSKASLKAILIISSILLGVIIAGGPIATASESHSKGNADAQQPVGFPHNWQAHPPVHVRTGLSPAISSPLSPAQIRTVYNLPSTGGSGTIAIIDAFDDPYAESDLGVFSNHWSLPACTTSNGCFEKVDQRGGTNYPKGDSGWGLEISLDTQWAHAIAPNAKILLVEANSNSGNDLLAAVDYARKRPDVVAISMSWGGLEFSGESSLDSYFTSTYGANFFAASGDNGYAAGVQWPAVSSNVVGVGGTTITLNSDGSVASETAWSGSGGGLSAYETEPQYQVKYGVPGANGWRAVPDVSYNGGPNSAVSVYDTFGYPGWLAVYGTSAGAPQWAAIQSLGLSSSNPNFYQDAKSSSYSSYFRDIIIGTNGNCGLYCTATTGYDYVTGLGSPLTTNYNPAPTPDFSLSATPSSQTVVQGTSTSYTVTITPSGGFSGSVTLSASGLPIGASASFKPNPAAGSSTMTITTSTTTPTGSYTLTITGTNGTLTHTTTVVLNIPDFSLSASPSSLSIVQGNSKASTITVSALNGYTGTVTLSVSGIPSGASAILNPASVINSGTSTLTVNAGTAAIGSYTLTITGTDGTLTHTTTVAVVITALPTADFSLSASPASQTVVRGSSTSYAVTITRLSGFAGAVTFSVAGLPSGASGTFNPKTTTTTGTSSTLSIVTQSTTPTGSYLLTITGTSGSLTHTTSVTLVVRKRRN